MPHLIQKPSVQLVILDILSFCQLLQDALIVLQLSLLLLPVLTHRSIVRARIHALTNLSVIYLILNILLVKCALSVIPHVLTVQAHLLQIVFILPVYKSLLFTLPYSILSSQSRSISIPKCIRLCVRRQPGLIFWIIIHSNQSLILATLNMRMMVFLN